MSVVLLLHILAAICFFVAMLPLPTVPTEKLIAAGLFFWALTLVISGAR